MNQPQETVAVPVPLADALSKLIQSRPVSEVTQIWDAWREVVKQHNESKQPAPDRDLDAAELKVVDDVTSQEA